MDIFSIKEAEALTGIKAHTLRIWELRYEMKLSTCQNSRIRIYSVEEMKFLMRISYLIRTGYKISQISKFTAPTIAELTVQFNADTPRLDTYYNCIMEAILDIDNAAFKNILKNFMDEYSSEIIIQEVLLPVSIHLENIQLASKRNLVHTRLGNQWISEFICYCTEFLPKKFQNNMQLFILFTPENQKFETKLLVNNFMFRKNYIQTIYLGTHIPIELIKEMTQAFPHANLCFDLGFKDYSATFRSYINTLVEYIDSGKVYYTSNQRMGMFANLPKNVFEFKNIEDIVLHNETTLITL